MARAGRASGRRRAVRACWLGRDGATGAARGHPSLHNDEARFGDELRAKRLMGFEPTTFCMASRRSSQLSYSRTMAHHSPVVACGTAGQRGPGRQDASVASTVISGTAASAWETRQPTFASSAQVLNASASIPGTRFASPCSLLCRRRALRWSMLVPSGPLSRVSCGTCRAPARTAGRLRQTAHG